MQSSNMQLVTSLQLQSTWETLRSEADVEKLFCQEDWNKLQLCP